MLSVNLREAIPLLTRIVDFVPQHGPAEITHELSVSAAVNLAICRVVARDRTQTKEIDIIATHSQSNTCTETCTSRTDREEREPQEMLPPDTKEDRSTSKTDQEYVTTNPVRKSVDWSESVDDQQTEENIMQISGTGHWFLQGWIGDHAVDFLVDSGSAVTAISRPFFNRLSEAGVPVGVLRPTTRKLRGANGSQIEISSCSYCVV